MTSLLRTLGGVVALLLFFLGRGARLQGEYYVGIVSQIAAGIVALAVFVLYRRTCIGGPAVARLGTSRFAVGWLFLGVSGVLLISVASLLIAGSRDSGAAGQLIRRLSATTPDFAIKALTAILAAAAGVSAVAGSVHAAKLVRLAAVPLVPIWPLGTMLGVWGAWSTLSTDWQVDAVSRDWRPGPLRPIRGPPADQ